MKTSTITAHINGCGPTRTITATACVSHGIPRFAITGVTEDTARHIRHIVRTAFAKGGYQLPLDTKDCTLSFDVPFEDVNNLSLTLAVALLVATRQFDVSQLSHLRFNMDARGEQIRLEAA